MAKPPAKATATASTKKSAADAVAPTPVAKTAPAKAAAAKAAAAKAAADKAVVAKAPVPEAPVRKVVVKKPDHVRKPSDFDEKFLAVQKALLLEERVSLVGQADRLEGEAASLMEDLDPGDVQFDEESGEGDSLSAERDRDLALSAQARQMVADIDAALLRIADKSYGYSLISGQPIPKERLEALPWATELVQEKVGGLGSPR